MKKRKNIVALAFIVGFLLSACSENHTPKPRGYFRIDLPEHEYIAFDTTFPYAFEYPVYAEINPDPFAPEEPYWLNIDFPEHKGRIHISYKTVDGNLAEYLEDSRQFVMKHIPKASAINDSLILDRERKLYGLVYYIEGMGAASPCQFFVTDSTRHFVRGALYFDVVPNNDSLAPVIDFLQKDIEHLLSTFQWK
ncbi:MAG: gliding motility lipoprotein GldD [Bacteroidales bacterium]|jgi:gliding motility-associated lipoprotein GldD|nr:gliding motility lipoprotein GldD [Bacteroidales bacterium]